MAHEQINLFDFKEKPKHIRLIELFAGIGAQSKALEVLGADFEIWRTCEWSWKSIVAYNAIHMGGRIEDTSHLSYEEVLAKINGVSSDYNSPMTEKQLRAKGEPWAREILGRMMANRNVTPNVSKLTYMDLDIRERERNEYVLFYSYPCTDLSNAGKQLGMSKGSGTHSGLLWEVERILLECKEHDCLPQTLIMENVPAVLSKKFKKDFNSWMNSLESMGYCNSYQIMNSKDFGIPQNRNRLFMVSRLNETPFFFPKEMKLKYVLRDFLDKDIPEDYYFSDEFLERLDKCKGVELVK